MDPLQQDWCGALDAVVDRHSLALAQLRYEKRQMTIKQTWPKSMLAIQSNAPTWRGGFFSCSVSLSGMDFDHSR